MKRWIASIVLAGCAAVAAPGSAATAQSTAGQPIAGVRCDAAEGTAFHVHQHLSILDHGKPLRIPPDVGQSLVGQCLYWLHTHTPDGIIHVEAPSIRTFTLGQFFAVWGEPLSRTHAAGASLHTGERMSVWLNGARYAGDPAKIELVEHADIVIELGGSSKRPLPFNDWKKL